MPDNGNRPSQPPAGDASGVVSLPGRTAADLVAFAREHPRAAARAFDSLSLEDRVRMVRSVSARDRLELILLAREIRPLIRALPAADLFFTVKEAGDDAAELVRHASDDQVRLLLDLDCWKGDRIDPSSVDEWLGLLRETERFEDALPAIDIELLVAWLRKRMRLWKADSDGVLPADAPPGLITLDGTYHLEAIDPSTDPALVRALLAEARSRSSTFYWRLVEGALNEADVELEAQAFRWRESRLNDEGFPSLDDALHVYARLEARSFDPARHPKPEPIEAGTAPDETRAALAVRGAGRPGDLLFRRAWDAGPASGDWGAIEAELASLLNRILVADGVALDSPEGIRRLFDRAHATLSLGLELAVRALAPADGDEVSAAVRLLREVRLEALFRLGFTRTLQVRDEAVRAAGEAIDDAPDDWIAILDPPLPGAIAAARLDRPLLFTGLLGEDPPERREHRTLAEVDLALGAMRRARALRPLWEHLGKIAVPGSLEGGSETAGERASPGVPHLAGLALTAFANAVLEGFTVLRPVPRSRLLPLRDALLDPERPGARPRLRENAPARMREAFAPWLDGLAPALRSEGEAFLTESLEKLASALSVPDPEFGAADVLLLSRA